MSLGRYEVFFTPRIEDGEKTTRHRRHTYVWGGLLPHGLAVVSASRAVHTFMGVGDIT